VLGFLVLVLRRIVFVVYNAILMFVFLIGL
jgi:hypothetical protein